MTEYIKLGLLTEDVEAGETTIADVVAQIDAGDLHVVNIKGRILTSAEVQAHLSGGTDGETVVWP